MWGGSSFCRLLYIAGMGMGLGSPGVSGLSVGLGTGIPGKSGFTGGSMMGPVPFSPGMRSGMGAGVSVGSVAGAGGRS